MEKRNLFSKYKYCQFCGCPIDAKSEINVCSVCEENELFHKVKDFIRENNVNEFQVASEFNIPINQVKKWIRDGRIEYKKDDTKTIVGLHCQLCGGDVMFGTLCPKCLKAINNKKQGYGTNKTGNAQMRFLDDM